VRALKAGVRSVVTLDPDRAVHTAISPTKFQKRRIRVDDGGAHAQNAPTVYKWFDLRGY
jgi:hypothetical protein